MTLITYAADDGNWRRCSSDSKQLPDRANRLSSDVAGVKTSYIRASLIEAQLVG